MSNDIHLFRITAASQHELKEKANKAKLQQPVCLETRAHHITFLYSDDKSFQEQLNAHQNKTYRNKSTPICFLYTGQGSQYPGMGKKLYESIPLIKNKLDTYQEVLYKFNGENYLECLLSDNEIIHQTSHTQPCMVMLQLALSQLWQSMNITPSVVIGHSVGEFSASVQKGHYNEEQCLTLIAKRAKCMQQLSVNGGMIAIRATTDNVQAMLDTHNIDIDYAAWNAPKQVVLSGSIEKIIQVKKACDLEKIRSTELQVSHPFHSRLMSPMLNEFCNYAKTIPAQNGHAHIHFIRNTNGNVQSKPPCEKYWSKHILEPVHFRQSIELTEKMEINTYLELGPDQTLSRLASRCFSTELKPVLLGSMKKNTCPISTIVQCAIALENEGHHINWQPLAHCIDEHGKISQSSTE